MKRWEIAYRAWLRAAEKGYGSTTSATRAEQIDANIRRLKARYERLLAEAKAKEKK
jgi:hypothetical protein